MENKLLFTVILLTATACAHRNSASNSDPQPLTQQPGPSESKAALERASTAEAEMPHGEDPVADSVGAHEREREARETDRDLEQERSEATLSPGTPEPGADSEPEQGTDAADLDLTRRVRGALKNDPSLSFTAKNVQVVSKDGMVTLRGLVSSQSEKRAVFRRAVAEAGDGRVRDRVDVRNQE